MAAIFPLLTSCALTLGGYFLFAMPLSRCLLTVSDGVARFVGSSDTPQPQTNFDATQLELASVAYHLAL